jgi:hypothetical protein
MLDGSVKLAHMGLVPGEADKQATIMLSLITDRSLPAGLTRGAVPRPWCG